MLKIFPTGIIARTGTSEHSLSHPFKNYGAVGNGLTGIKNTYAMCLFILNWSQTH